MATQPHSAKPFCAAIQWSPEQRGRIENAQVVRDLAGPLCRAVVLARRACGVESPRGPWRCPTRPLSPYSPELNPDEYLNGDLKHAVHQNVSRAMRMSCV